MSLRAVAGLTLLPRGYGCGKQVPQCNTDDDGFRSHPFLGLMHRDLEKMSVCLALQLLGFTPLLPPNVVLAFSSLAEAMTRTSWRAFVRQTDFAYGKLACLLLILLLPII